ncbi:hypothetical protein ACWD5R_43510 [Streptomyces sp. NPDC002514]|uniref:hypothetical protein n=1 Tax=Streptomyces sp. NPDC001270 TaxID=3364554 RepID=UPI0036A02D8F
MTTPACTPELGWRPQTLPPLPHNQLEQAVRLRLSAQDGFGSLLAQLPTQLARDTDPYQPADGPRPGTVVVDLLSALIAHALDSDNSLPPETRPQALVIGTRIFAQQHLHDPHLNPRAIAAGGPRQQ